MANAVTFNYNAWIARYPEFGPSGSQPVDSTLAQLYFDEAGLYLENVNVSVISSIAQQSQLMNMLTAHIAALNAAQSGGGGSSPLVGRVSSATEGSVSVSSENDYPPGTPQWYQQTKYGAAYWAATIQYRTMHYIPGPVEGVPANQTGRLFSGFGVGIPFRRRW